MRNKDNTKKINIISYIKNCTVLYFYNIIPVSISLLLIKEYT